MHTNSSKLVSFDERHAPSYGAEPVIDRDAFSILEELADEDDPELVGELLALFLDDSSTRIEQIASGEGEDASTAIGAAAHALKSSSANIGALPFSMACARLEAAARGGEQENDLSELVVQVTSMYEDLCRALAPAN